MPKIPNSGKFRVEALGPAHERADFSCGIPALDFYLQKQAGQDLRKRVAAVYVMTGDGHAIAGFYSLSQFSIELDEIPEDIARKLPRYPDVPATLIGRLAISRDFRGLGLGEFLLMDALNRCLENSRPVASAAVIVDAKNADAAAFYSKYGFLRLPRVSDRLFLPMATIARMFSE